MHMADALISPLVGGIMAAASVGAAAYSVKKIRDTGLDDKTIPMMGVMGAFVFAGQMINFTIPLTGSSGHIGGGILLAAMLGPFPAFLTIAAVLLIQCLFFADGGLLALGCNIFNMGFWPCFIAFPLIYRAIIKAKLSNTRIMLASILSVMAGLQLGAFSVVLETMASGVTELPFASFALLMQPIHLAIGAVEGIVTGAVLIFVKSMRPELIEAQTLDSATKSGTNIKKVLVAMAAATALIAGGLSLFASANPDGLEWAMEHVAGTTELERSGDAYSAAADVQNATAFMPDYSLPTPEGEEPAPAGTSMAGIIGSALTLALAVGAGALITLGKKRNRKKKEPTDT